MSKHTYAFVGILLLCLPLIIQAMDIPNWKTEVSNAQIALQGLEDKANTLMNNALKGKQLLEFEVYGIKEMRKLITGLTQNAEKNNYAPDENDLYQVNQSVVQLTSSLNQTIKKVENLNKK